MQKQQSPQRIKPLDAKEIALVSGGLTDDLSAFPVRFWPIINPGTISQIAVKTVIR